MDAWRRARRNLAIFWLSLIGIPSALGVAAMIWVAASTPTYMN